MNILSVLSSNLFSVSTYSEKTLTDSFLDDISEYSTNRKIVH